MTRHPFTLVYRGAITKNEPGKVNIHPVTYTLTGPDIDQIELIEQPLLMRAPAEHLGVTDSIGGVLTHPALAASGVSYCRGMTVVTTQPCC